MSKPQSNKVRIDFDSHPSGHSGESIWADHIMEDLYEVRNIPFLAYGINYQDVVRVFELEDGTLQIKEVLRKSSHHTIRVFFVDDKSPEENYNRIMNFKGEGVGSEKWNDSMYSLNVTPERDYEEFIESLESLEDQGVIQFELAGEWSGGFDGSE
ncbi:DUF4265 domain-containing protein [Microbulbifer agarilyticus]